nr:CDP-diacylglycerol--serine O-phosphatidyltransferase [Rhodococcus rhodnii]
MLPSVITILALCAGLSSVKFALDGQIGTAIGFVGAAAVLDSLDGRVARLLDATSKIGAELDSLADAISFGVAPALVLYVTLLDGHANGWILALVFAVCTVLRLARFNTLLDEEMPAYSKDYFVGVPAPAGALVALAPLAASAQWGDGWWESYGLVAAWILFSSVLVVSRVPTLALKRLSVPPRMAAGLLVLVAVGAAALVTYPFILLLVLVGGYLVHIPFAIRSQRWVAARPDTWDFPARERRAIRRDPSRRHSSEARRLGLRRPESRGRDHT